MNDCSKESCLNRGERPCQRHGILSEETKVFSMVIARSGSDTAILGAEGGVTFDIIKTGTAFL